ncbi:MAG: 3'-5' exonuclease [Candidatus Moraniibacteriota bacterium]|nr:MAG: 3'-5' exonuclease [Candidatus Moranbacteria bacterium]
MHSILPELIMLERPLVVFDLETTGLTPGDDRTIEIAYQKILPTGEVHSGVRRLNPGKPIPEDSTAVHGIRDEDVSGEPTFASLCYELWSIFEGADVGGYNVYGYDLPFLRAEFALVGKNFEYANRKILDAKFIFHKFAPRDLVSRRDLSAACKEYLGETHTSAHTAEGDVAVTVKILEKQLERYPEFRDWEKVMELLGRKKSEGVPPSSVSAAPPSLRKPGSLF